MKHVFKKGDKVRVRKSVFIADKRMNDLLPGSEGKVFDPEPFPHEHLVEVDLGGEDQNLFYFWERELELV